MKLYLITDNADIYAGLRMTGIDGIVLHSEAELAPAIATAAADPTIAVLLVTGRLAQKAQVQLMAYKISAATPLVLELPDRYSTSRRNSAIDWE